MAIPDQILAFRANVSSDPDVLGVFVGQCILGVDLQRMLRLLGWVMRQWLIFGKQSHNFVVLLICLMFTDNFEVLDRVDLLVEKKLRMLHRDNLLEDGPFEVQRVPHLRVDLTLDHAQGILKVHDCRVNGQTLAQH